MNGHKEGKFLFIWRGMISPREEVVFVGGWDVRESVITE